MSEPIDLKLIGEDGDTLATVRTKLRGLLVALGAKPTRDAFGSWPENRVYYFNRKADGVTWDTVRRIKRADVQVTIKVTKHIVECGDLQPDGTGTADPVDRGWNIDILFAPVSGKPEALARALRRLVKEQLFDLLPETDETLPAKMQAKSPGKTRRVRRHATFGLGSVNPEFPAMTWA